MKVNTLFCLHSNNLVHTYDNTLQKTEEVWPTSVPASSKQGQLSK